jgi:hypothetical protein
MRKCGLGLFLLLCTPILCAGEVKKSDTKTYQVPFRLTSTNHVLVRVKINGKGPYNFILDTGAPALFVSTAVGTKLGVKPDKQGWGKFDRFEMEGGVVLDKVRARVENPFQIEGMNGLGLAGAELHGIIGYTVLARYRLEFDFSKPGHKMSWKPLDYNPPEPIGLGGQAAPAGMDAIGGIMKIMGALLGKKAEPQIILRGFLGIVLQDAEDGVKVQAVLQGSPAAEAGLKPGDRIQRFQDRSVSRSRDVYRLANKLAPDETAQLKVTRGAETLSIQIKAGKGL